MSAFGGIWHTDSRPLARTRLLQLKAELQRYGTDFSSIAEADPIGMVFCARHNTPQDQREMQPLRSDSGTMITWDGRLDNRSDLIETLGAVCDQAPSDASLVLTALDCWGERALKAIKGDWCLAYWSPAKQEMILATDYVGNRRCYYCRRGAEVVWSSGLSAILRINAGLSLNDDFVAAYSYGAMPDGITPFKEIRMVGPGTLVRLSPSSERITSYWHWDDIGRIRYQTSAEYDEHFRHLFTVALQRRLRTFRPVLAELSGGVDSSAIVCCAHRLIKHGLSESPGLRTISYYDHRDAASDERPYFTLVETAIGQTGWHIDLADHDVSGPQPPGPVPFPGVTPTQYSLFLALQRCHHTEDPGTVLSGSGGDEVLGGLTDAVAHIVEHMKESRINTASLIEAWSIAEKTTWARLTRDLTSELVFNRHPVGAGLPANAPWLRKELRILGAEYWRAEHRLPRLGRRAAPGVKFLLFGLDTVSRRSWNKLGPLTHVAPHTFPYLDRDLVEFLLKVPVAEIYGPGERRRLVRRALAGYVPNDILWRKSKGYTMYWNISQLRSYRADLEARHYVSPLFSMGYADPASFGAELTRAIHGIQDRVIFLIAAQALDVWLRQLVVP